MVNIKAHCEKIKQILAKLKQKCPAGIIQICDIEDLINEIQQSSSSPK